jgi:hypothetical protein
MSVKTRENLAGSEIQQQRQAIAKAAVDRILSETPRQISMEMYAREVAFIAFAEGWNAKAAEYQQTNGGGEVRELLCQRCNSEYPVWFCPNEIWNAVQQTGEHFFCPTCFAILAEERGIRPTAWFVRPEKDSDGETSLLKRQNIDLASDLALNQQTNGGGEVAKAIGLVRGALSGHYAEEIDAFEFLASELAALKQQVQVAEAEAERLRRGLDDIEQIVFADRLKKEMNEL